MKTKAQLRQALQEILEAAENHPCFAGHAGENDREEIASDGGDVAFVTLDIAWVAKEALK